MQRISEHRFSAGRADASRDAIWMRCLTRAPEYRGFSRDREGIFAERYARALVPLLYTACTCACTVCRLASLLPAEAAREQWSLYNAFCLARPRAADTPVVSLFIFSLFPHPLSLFSCLSVWREKYARGIRRGETSRTRDGVTR